MKDILSEIVAHKRLELQKQQEELPIEKLRAQVEALPKAPHRSMKQSLLQSSTGIIAEFKCRSPSKGWIHEGADPCDVVPSYARYGAAALSVLTDELFFGGSLKDIIAIRKLTDIPILRKDFIISEYQLLQARLADADAVLLIAACLDLNACRLLASKAHALGLETLLEIHSTNELCYVSADVDMVGVNNRNLGTFVTDVQNSFRISEQLKEAVLKTCPDTTDSRLPLLVSESGISKAETIRSLREVGFRGFLMGEAFMKHEHPGEALHHLCKEITI